MTSFTHHGEETPVAQELRIDVVLDLVGQAAGLAPVGPGDVELPILPRHRLVGDQGAVRVECRSAERPGGADQRPRLGADGTAHQEPLVALVSDEGERAPVGAHDRRVTAVDRGRAAGGEHRDPGLGREHQAPAGRAQGKPVEPLPSLDRARPGGIDGIERGDLGGGIGRRDQVGRAGGVGVDEGEADQAGQVHAALAAPTQRTENGGRSIEAQVGDLGAIGREGGGVSRQGIRTRARGVGVEQHGPPGTVAADLVGEERTGGAPAGIRGIGRQLAGAVELAGQQGDGREHGIASRSGEDPLESLEGLGIAARLPRVPRAVQGDARGHLRDQRARQREQQTQDHGRRS